MKDFRVIGITGSHIKASNQRVLVFDLAEVEWSNYTLPSNSKSYHFGMNGEKYVVGFNSNLSKKLNEAAHNEEIISLDLAEFTTRNEKRNGEVEKVYFHNSVNLFSKSAEIQSETYDYKSKELNGGQLALLADGLMKNTLPKPKNEELLVERLRTGGCRIFFQKDYYESLIEIMNEYYYNGSFAKSNAYSEWTDLKKAIDSARIENEVDKSELQIHFATDHSMNTQHFHFNYTCRHCLHSVQDEHIISIEEESIKKINFFNTEFKTRKELEEIRAFENLLCPICKSSNLLIYNLKHNNFEIYRRSDLKSCIDSKIGIYIKIEKCGIQLKPVVIFSDNFNIDSHKHILELFFQEIIEYTFSQQNNIFVSSINGQSDIMLRAEEERFGTITEMIRFNNIGITRNELFKCIYDISEKYAIDVHLNEIDKALSKENFSIDRNPFESILFKGALMNKTFQLSSIEESKLLNIPYIHICYNDGDRIIAYGISNFESREDFYIEHRNNDFMIPPNPKTILLRGKILYFAVKVN